MDRETKNIEKKSHEHYYVYDGLRPVKTAQHYKMTFDLIITEVNIVVNHNNGTLKYFDCFSLITQIYSIFILSIKVKKFYILS